MRKFYRSLLSLLLFVSVTRAGAQTGNDFSQYTDFLPAPPNASAIIKANGIALNKNTGAVSVAVPLFTVKGNKLAVQTSLSYGSTGIKVEETSSRVGMGWALNAGGVVTRTVRHIPDEKRPRRGDPWSNPAKDWPTYNFISSLLLASNSSGYDGEPDLFSFNFGGYSGSFILDNNMNVLQIVKSDLKIFYNFTASDWNFKIVAPDGITYFFGGNTATEQSRRISACGKVFDQYLPNAWYLKKIVHPNGETIDFTYIPHTYEYQTGVSQTMYYVNPLTAENFACGGDVSGCPPIAPTVCVGTSRTQGVLLKSITAPKRMRLDLTYTDRLDNPDSLVKKIELFDLRSNEVHRSFVFSYDQVFANTAYLSEIATGADVTPYLSALTERSSDTLDQRQHRFSYLDPGNRAPRLSFAQDHWGYFNGAANTSLVPRPNESINGGGLLAMTRFPGALGNREANGEFAMKGMLSKIMYPTGGADSLVYEGNTVRKTILEGTPHTITADISGEGIHNTLTDTVTFHIGEPQDVELFVSCVNNTGSGELPHQNKGSVTLTSGSFIYSDFFNPGHDTTITMHLSDTGRYFLMYSAAGEKVSLTTRISYNVMRARRHNVPYGGVRLKSVLTGNRGERPMLTTYYYGHPDSLNVSSLVEGPLPNYMSQMLMQYKCGSEGGFYSCNTTYLYSNSINSLADYQSSLASYTDVVESHGPSFYIGGGTHTAYYATADGPGEVLYGQEFANATKTNFSNALNGKVKEENIYKLNPSGNRQLVNKKIYNYTLDARGENAVFGYVASARRGPLNTMYNPSALDSTDYSYVAGSPYRVVDLVMNGLDLMRYRVLADWVYLDSLTEINYPDHTDAPTLAVTSGTKFYYNNSVYAQVSATETRNSKQQLVRSEFGYPYDFSGQAVYDSMTARNIISPVVTTKTITAGITTTEVRSNFANWGGGVFAPASLERSNNGGGFYNEGTFENYDAAGNLTQFVPRSGLRSSVLWGYDYTYPVAEIKGSSFSTATAALGVSYAQLQDLDGWGLRNELNKLRSIGNTQATTYEYKPITGVASITDLNNRRSTYEYDAFDRLIHIRDNDSNIVKKFEYSYAGPDPVFLPSMFYNTAKSQQVYCQCDTGFKSGTPQNYTVPAGKYFSLVSQAAADSIASADVTQNAQSYANSRGDCHIDVSHVFYNVAKSGNFTKNNCASGGTGSTVTFTVAAGTYSTTANQHTADTLAIMAVASQGQAYANANGTCTFFNVEKSGNFVKNDCSSGTAAGSVTYTVAAGTYSSTTSQADADSKAQDDVNGNGQAYANAHGTCLYFNTAQSGTFTKNNCASGGTGSSVTYNVAASVYTSNISQADADSKAQADVNANGQAYANSNGSCTFYNTHQSGSYQKNNCTSGGTGAYVTYNVSANAYSSTISQADADSKAIAEIAANGQAYANANGQCTFYNTAQSVTYQKNNCAPGGTGSNVTYTILSGTFSSFTSQADADNQALSYANANGQAYANSNGVCTFYSVSKSGTYTKNNCASGGTGSSVTYTIAASAYTSNISQADADSKAQADVNANGQSYANSNGYCTFYNTAQSGSFTKNNCASGGTGSSVTYTVAANTYSSNTSQSAANDLAIAAVNANGQSFANANGYCTFYNTTQSGTFQVNTCSEGGTGAYVTYYVYAGSYSSTTSQAHADAIAAGVVSANGQAFANANAGCTYSSAPQSKSFQKNDCASGGTGSSVTYSVGAGAYVSTTSLADANANAMAIVNANGQAYANANGYCTFYNTTQSGSFTKNNCAPGGTGSSVTYTVAANTYSSNTSQAAANNLAINDVNANGQAYANANGYCTFYNTTQSGTFQVNTCSEGGTGSFVTYYVYAGSYSSTISQAHADAIAAGVVSANGQAFANANAGCSYPSAAQSGSFQKNNCASGGTGSWVTYSIGAGAYISTVSLADANANAMAIVNANGPSYANANGYCTFYNTAQSSSFQKNNCASGGTGSWVTYYVGANNYSSTISQADADSKAAAEISANGQAYANANGYCTWYNVYKSQTFTKNDCGSYASGSSVTYSVGAGTYSSNVSQADADDQAQSNINSNGQNYANSNGSCTYYNSEVSQAFQKQCSPGYAGSYVTYTVPAYTYSSNVSQHDAQVAATADKNANGQAYANANGTCTYVCDSGNCSGEDKKCVNNVCETGVKVYTSSEMIGHKQYICIYHYEFSDGSWSGDIVEESPNNCML